MARFVLVHGAFAAAWAWGPLSERLEAAGHSVEALDLPDTDHSPHLSATDELGVLVERLAMRSAPRAR